MPEFAVEGLVVAVLPRRAGFENRVWVPIWFVMLWGDLAVMQAPGFDSLSFDSLVGRADLELPCNSLNHKQHLPHSQKVTVNSTARNAGFDWTALD